MVYAYRFTTSEVPAKVPVATKSSSGAACAAFQQAAEKLNWKSWKMGFKNGFPIHNFLEKFLENGFHLEIVTRNCDFGVQCSFSWVYINSKREKKTSSQFMPRKSGDIMIGSSSDPYSK